MEDEQIVIQMMAKISIQSNIQSM